MGRVCSCVLVQMNRSAVTKRVKSCDLLLLQICLFNVHTFTETLFLFDPHYPIILGGLGNSEGNVGYVQVGTLCCILNS